MAFPNNRIPFPIPNAVAGRDHRWALINRDLIGDPSPSTIRAIAFSPLLLAASRAVQMPARPFILIDMLVDPLMPDRLALFLL
jgi:hypothetical protein